MTKEQECKDQNADVQCMEQRAVGDEPETGLSVGFFG